MLYCCAVQQVSTSLADMVFNAEQNMRAVRAQHEAQLQAMRAEVFQPAALQAPAVLALQVAAILCTKQSHPIPIALSSAPRHTFRPGCSTLVHSNLLYSTQLYSTLAYMYSTQFYSTQHVVYYTLCPTILYSKPYSFLLSYSPLRPRFISFSYSDSLFTMDALFTPHPVHTSYHKFHSISLRPRSHLILL